MAGIERHEPPGPQVVGLERHVVRGRDLEKVCGLVPAGTDGWSVTRVLGVVLKVCGLPIDDLMLLKPGTLPKTSSGKLQRAKARRR